MVNAREHSNVSFQETLFSPNMLLIILLDMDIDFFSREVSEFFLIQFWGIFSNAGQSFLFELTVEIAVDF